MTRQERPSLDGEHLDGRLRPGGRAVMTAIRVDKVSTRFVTPLIASRTTLGPSADRAQGALGRSLSSVMKPRDLVQRRETGWARPSGGRAGAGRRARDRQAIFITPDSSRG